MTGFSSHDRVVENDLEEISERPWAKDLGINVGWSSNENLNRCEKLKQLLTSAMIVETDYHRLCLKVSGV
jgi:hypothetical protein